MNYISNTINKTFKNKYHKDTLKIAINMAWPAIIESFFIAFAGLIDSLMVSSLGSASVAAVGLTTQPKLLGLALFFALAASSVALVVLASGSYSRQVHTSEDSYTSCTALSYVTEKLHQADNSDAIDAGTFDGQDAILIRQEYSGQSYVTYLYAYDGYLRELFIKEGVAASAGDGREILATDGFSFEESRDGLFHLSCTDSNGNLSDTYVSIKSSR